MTQADLLLFESIKKRTPLAIRYDYASIAISAISGELFSLGYLPAQFLSVLGFADDFLLVWRRGDAIHC
jgi:hypothetical protein